MTTSPVPLDQFIAETNAFVDPWRIPDLAPTGLQVRAAADDDPVPVRRVALAVSATWDMIRAADGWGAPVLLTHHGMFWGTTRPTYDPARDPARPWDEARVALLREYGVSLASWHLPLDAHAEIGNNAMLARLRPVALDFGVWPGTNVALGLHAEAPGALSALELAQRAEHVLGSSPIVIAGKPDGIRSVGIVSGGGARDLYEAIDRGLDAFITGEGELWAYDLARDAGVTLLVLGHHASERYGIQALGAWAGRRFGVETRFFDESNPF